MTYLICSVLKISQIDPKTKLILDHHESLIPWIRLNLQSALHTALILLPESFTEEQFYMTLAGLSYTGDFRMVIGEDRNKGPNSIEKTLPSLKMD